jgi:hypothetical protein
MQGIETTFFQASRSRLRDCFVLQTYRFEQLWYRLAVQPSEGLKQGKEKGIGVSFEKFMRYKDK